MERESFGQSHIAPSPIVRVELNQGTGRKIWLKCRLTVLYFSMCYCNVSLEKQKKGTSFMSGRAQYKSKLKRASVQGKTVTCVCRSDYWLTYCWWAMYTFPSPLAVTQLNPHSLSCQTHQCEVGFLLTSRPTRRSWTGWSGLWRSGGCFSCPSVYRFWAEHYLGCSAKRC